ncbi:MarR family winged helix-turn-helix transcriptional regulator [Tianweitania sp.]|uniref:MarR family winged helix-turn-helix transcriptional regulator n=1 Tax=Tianweitania sp. TaxID=2021634 RepID=UPI00289BD04E|nr:MarR family transcriptional regulator [Tianweitania sp.]
MARTLDPDSFGFLVTDLARLLRNEADQRFKDAGCDMTHGEGRVLAHAARAGTVRQNVLAERMGIEAMTLSGLLDRLETRELVKRTPDPADRRAKLISVTEEADALLDKVQQVSAGIRTDLAGEFPDADWQQFTIMLKAVRDRLLTMRADGQANAA